MSTLETWRVGILTGAAVGQTAFVVFYASLPWWRTYLGRSLFFKSTTFALLLDIAVAGRLWDWSYEEAYIVALYALVALGIWGQLFAFIRQDRQGPKP